MHALISHTCADILTEEELHELGYNDSFLITEDKAEAIATRLEEVLASPMNWLEAKEKVKASLESISEKYHLQENPYKFTADNVRWFIEFARNSGGFEVC